MGKSKVKKKLAEKKLKKKKEGQEDFLKRLRESAPSPEPVPDSMEATHQQTQDRGGVSWEKYANGKSMSGFGDLSSSNNNQASFNKVADKNSDKATQDLMKLPMVNTPMPQGCLQLAKPTCPESSDSVINNSPEGHQPIFGKPSPLRYGSKTPLWVRANAEMAEATPHSEPSVYDLYQEHLEKGLQESIEQSTMNLAARIIIHVTTYSGYRWLNRWCPGMNMCEVFETISVESIEAKLVDKQYNVPPEAIDTRMMTTSLAGMYQRCHDAYPNGSGDIQFPQLLKLIDECTTFLGLLKENNHKTLLQKTKSMFQWTSIGLGAKRLIVLKQARADLEKLNGPYKHSVGNSNTESDNLKQSHQEEESSILDAAASRFEIYRKTFETEILHALNTLLASTNEWPPKPDGPGVH
ncbi:hypothetical protein F4859DRAFT_523741 [Xylaria cf. heliscus]|nr:hypothetical protein F4859DRAFT_523741 [Xylaria cf. heliscus]